MRPSCIPLSKLVKEDGNITEMLVQYFSVCAGLPHMHDLSIQNIPGDWNYYPHFTDGERAV